MPGEHAVEVPRSLVRDRVDHLRAQVVLGALQRLGEVGLVGDQRQHLVHQVAVPAEQVVDARAG